MDPTDDLSAALALVLNGYEDLITVATDLAERAAVGGHITADDLALYPEKFGTVGAQIDAARSRLAALEIMRGSDTGTMMQ